MKKINTAHRELHLIDIENELGTSAITTSEITRFRKFYLSANDVPIDAHIVIATSSAQGLLEASVGWPGARTVFIPGKDGADLALVDIALTENVDQRYEKVTIASGDGIFTDTAVRLQNLGVEVTVFARSTCLNTTLWSACHDVHLFSGDDFVLAA